MIFLCIRLDEKIFFVFLNLLNIESFIILSFLRDKNICICNYIDLYKSIIVLMR